MKNSPIIWFGFLEGNLLKEQPFQVNIEENIPVHPVHVNAFWMDKTEVTNFQFKKFIDATGYITTAERKPDWEELKKELPPNTPKPNDSLLKAASLVFEATDGPVNLNDYGVWWHLGTSQCFCTLENNV